MVSFHKRGKAVNNPMYIDGSERVYLGTYLRIRRTDTDLVDETRKVNGCLTCHTQDQKTIEIKRQDLSTRPWAKETEEKD